MRLNKLVEDCIENFNLDVTKLRDIAFAICTSDKLNGTNNKELDVDLLVQESDGLDWNDILQLLNIHADNSLARSLPRVQKLRVVSDVLSLSLSDKIDDLHLTNVASGKVAKELGVSLPKIDYADEDICYENLKKIEEKLSEVSLDLGRLQEVYKKLCIYSNKILEVGGFNLPTDVEKILIPDTIFNNLGKKCSVMELKSFLDSKNLSINDYAEYVIDIYCYNIVQEVAKLLNAKFKSNEVAFNLVLTRLCSFASDYLPVGTYSLNGYTQRLSVLRNVPSYLARKVNVVFSESTTFSEMTIQGCICVLFYLRKTNIKKDEFINEMEVLINECRK